VIGLLWKAGRSDNRAHWSFSPGAHGGTVTALDEHAEELLDPNSHRAPRTLRAVAERDQFDQFGDPAQPTLDSAVEPEPVAPIEEPPAAVAAPRQAVAPREPAAAPKTVAAKAVTAKEPASVVEPVREPKEDDTREIPRVPAEEPKPKPQPAPKPASRASRSKKPIVPSWEDVLLGVRSQRG
jgi:hypothetical protein